MPRRISRRQFLKVTGTAAGLMATPGVARAYAAGLPQTTGPSGIDFFAEDNDYNAIYGNPPALGILTTNVFWIYIFEEPYNQARRVRPIYPGFVMPIWEAVHGDSYGATTYNDVWFYMGEGYVWSSPVLPCHQQYHQPLDDIGDGFWGEITVPRSWQHLGPSEGANRDFSMFYGTVFWVADRVVDEKGQVWYRLEDEFDENSRWWVLAHHVRPIDPREFEPINPGVQDKRIEIDLQRQRVSCYEDGVPVFQVRTATGRIFNDDEGHPFDFQSQVGEYVIERKRPSRRMKGSEPAINDYFDLPGVPWSSYFVGSGAAIHGTYWHNDYGHTRSHGCINVTADAAKWIYRWSRPHAGYHDKLLITDPKIHDPTPIIIF
jgi:hypothetical protein